MGGQYGSQVYFGADFPPTKTQNQIQDQTPAHALDAKHDQDPPVISMFFSIYKAKESVAPRGVVLGQTALPLNITGWELEILSDSVAAERISMLLYKVVDTSDTNEAASKTNT